MLGAQERARVEGRRDIALAHTTAIFVKADKLKTLHHYLIEPAARAAGSLLDRVKALTERTKNL